MRALASGDGRYLMPSGMRVAMVWALVPWQPYAGVDEHKCGVRMDAQASVCFVLACIIYHLPLSCKAIELLSKLWAPLVMNYTTAPNI